MKTSGKPLSPLKQTNGLWVPQKPVPVPDYIRDEFWRLAHTYTPERVGKAIGCDHGSVLKAAAGLEVLPSTLAKLTDGLKRIRAELGGKVP